MTKQSLKRLQPHREESFPVKSYDVWQDGRLKLSALLNYFQEVASNHATSLGWGFENMSKSGVFWALHRIELEIDSLPKWEEVAIASTWIKGTERIFARRDFMLNDVQARVLVKAASAWLMVDMNNKRPKNPGIILDDMPSISHEGDLPISYQKIKPLSEEFTSMERKALPSELDLNQHVNNARYADWLMDAYSPDFLVQNRLKKVTIIYLQEAIFGDEVSIQVTRDAEKPLLHVIEIKRKPDNTIMLQAQIEWGKE